MEFSYVPAQTIQFLAKLRPILYTAQALFFALALLPPSRTPTIIQSCCILLLLEFVRASQEPCQAQLLKPQHGTLLLCIFVVAAETTLLIQHGKSVLHGIQLQSIASVPLRLRHRLVFP